MGGKSDLVKGALDLTAKLLGAGAEVSPKAIRAYHVSPHDFDVFKPSEFRGSTFFSSTPERARRGAEAGRNEMVMETSTELPPVNWRTYEVEIDPSRIKGLSLTPSENKWFEALPGKIVGDDALKEATKGIPQGMYWDDFYDETPISEGVYEYTKKSSPPSMSYEEAINKNRDIYRQQWPHYAGTATDEKSSALRLNDQGMGGYLLQDEGGLSFAINDPNSVRIIKKYAEGGSIREGYSGKGRVVGDIVDQALKLVAGGGEEAAKTGIRAYQGSPHNFAAERLVRFPEGRTEYIVGQPDVLPDVPEGAEVLQDFPLGRMRMDKIGTGEGAQAYGHGLYLAEQEGVAKDYRKNLAYKNLRDKFLEELPQDADFSEIEDLMSQGYFSPDQTRFLTELKNNDWLGFDYPSQAISAASRGRISNYDPSPELEEAANKLGHMYEVNIAADPNAFLDWDKTLREQPANVRDILSPWSHLDAGGPAGDILKWDMKQGGDLSGYLREKGIPGIKYLDAGSRVPSAMAKKELAEWQAQLPIAEKELADAVARGDSWLVARKQDEVQRVKNGIAAASGAAEGTRNYVVFDDRLISIIRKYGIAGASAMLGYNLMENLDANQAQAATVADKEYQATQPEVRGGMLPPGMEPSGEMTSRIPSASERIYDYVRSVLGGDEATKGQRAQTVMNIIDQTPLAVGPMAYDIARGATEMAGYYKGGAVRKGYATDGAVQPGPVFMEDAKGNKYDVAGNLIPPTNNAINDAVAVARREVDPYLKVPGHEHLKAVPPVTPPRPEYVPGEAISAATQPSRDVFWQGVEQFRNPQTEPRTPERAWELLSGAGQIGLGALGTAASGVVGAGVEALPTWLTGNQNQRNKLASELNEMTMFVDPVASPTAPIQKVGGIRNAAIVEGDLAKQRMLERGPSKLYDPLRVSSGIDPTEAGKAVANLKDAAIAKVGQTAEDAALKAAANVAGDDQTALALRTAQEPLPLGRIGHNAPPAKTLLETFDEENLPGVIVSPKPGTGNFTFATPDIIGMPVPPPMYNPVRKADVRPIAKDAEKILNSPGFRSYAEDQLGISGFDVTPTIGTWMGNPEPSFIIQGGNITPESAFKLTNALGFGFQQDAAVLTMHNPSIGEGIPTMLVGNGRELTKADVNRIMKAAKTQGLDFTVTKDGRAVRFSHFDGPETLPQFADKVMAVAEEAKMPEMLGVKTQGDLISADQYLNGFVPEASSGAGFEYGPGQSSNLLGGLVDTVLVPFSKSAAGQGYRLSPERLGQQYAIGPEIEARVAQGLIPRGDRSTIPLMEGKEKLPIKGTGARGEVVVDDVIDALSNRAARKGYIEPGDYSPKAMATIAKTIADEVYHHVTTSGKSAIGWYDATLKKAKSAYQRIFPELASDPQRNMLFDAILGITSQGADVHTNSINAVRIYNLVRDGAITLPQAVKKLSGTLGKETAAVEQNLLKLDELLSRNGYDRMSDLFNQTKTVGEWNKIFRADKSLYVNGKPFQIKGGKNQKVTGWMVFGPKIGSFINNLHGDYSTLTADLWFTRSWNRILGNSFVHDAGTEAAQFREFRDALKAEYAKTHDIRDPLMRQKYSPDVAGYSEKLVRGRKSGEPWEFGNDVANMSPEEFNALLNDPDAMLQYAYGLEQTYRKSGYTGKSDLRRRAKNWVEGRENAQAAPRADLERAFQQDTIEQTQKLLKKRGLDISVADIQAALWYYEKELFGKYGVASEKAAPADYFDAAQNTLQRFDDGTLYENKVEASNRAKTSSAKPENKFLPKKQAQKNFEAAFGQTYLKDPSGKPMRLYHMTPGDFSEFSASPENRSGPVVFLSPYADFQPASHQSSEITARGKFSKDFKEGANVMPVYADVRSPLVLDHPRKIREAAAKYQGGDRNFPRIVTPEAKAAMEADGYDAIVFGGDNPIPYGQSARDARLGYQEGREEEIIIFDPRKIKSATSNRGTYDTSDPDITKALGGSVEDDDIYDALRIARLQ